MGGPSHVVEGPWCPGPCPHPISHYFSCCKWQGPVPLRPPSPPHTHPNHLHGMVGPVVGQPRRKRAIGGLIPGAYQTLGERIAACADRMCRYLPGER